MGINSYYFNNIDGSLIDIDNGDFGYLLTTKDNY